MVHSHNKARKETGYRDKHGRVSDERRKREGFEF